MTSVEGTRFVVLKERIDKRLSPCGVDEPGWSHWKTRVMGSTKVLTFIYIYAWTDPLLQASHLIFTLPNILYLRLESIHRLGRA